MKHPHLLARAMEPVAMTEDALRVCLAVITDGALFADERARALADAGGMDSLMGRAPMRIENGTATIAVDGPLVRKAGGINAVSGLTSYEQIRSDLAAATSDPSVRRIVWAFDSPGGEVSGLFETADAIRAARSRVPMVAQVAKANSAAYVLAAAVGNIEIEQMGQAGSIGVIMAVPRPEADGGGVETFVSSVSPMKNADPTSDAGRAEYQSAVDFAGEQLVAKVAELRGVSPDVVRSQFGAGRVYRGAQAIERGLVDRILTGDPSPATGARTIARSKGARMDNQDNQVSAVEQFAADVVARVGATSHAEAIGKLAAIVEKAERLDAVEAALATERQAARSHKIGTALAAAVEGKRINLGELGRVVPALIGAAAKSALEGVAQESPAMIAALSGVPLSAESVEAVCAYLDAKSPVALPETVKSPEIPAGAVEADAASRDPEDARIKKIADDTRAAIARARGGK